MIVKDFHFSYYVFTASRQLFQVVKDHIDKGNRKIDEDMRPRVVSRQSVDETRACKVHVRQNDGRRQLPEKNCCKRSATRQACPASPSCGKNAVASCLCHHPSDQIRCGTDRGVWWLMFRYQILLIHWVSHTGVNAWQSVAKILCAIRLLDGPITQLLSRRHQLLSGWRAAYHISQQVVPMPHGIWNAPQGAQTGSHRS